jgi:hypothetical protein
MVRLGLALGVVLVCCGDLSAGDIEDLYRQQAKEGVPDPNPFVKVKKTGLTEIGLEHAGCYGPCPRYTVFIRRDGSVLYRGGEYAKRKGEYTGRVSEKSFARLAQFILESGFLELQNSYSIGTTDLATVYTTVVVNGKRKVVSDYADAGPTKLWAVEQLIDKLLLEVTWDDKAQKPEG